MANTPTVLFVCLHGSAKSVIAERHFERLAAERRVEARVASAGVEPDASVPPHVVAGLEADGLLPPGHPPRRATPELVAAADVVVSFGCDVAGLGSPVPVLRWDDVPAVSDGYAAARDAIVTRLPAVIDALASSTGSLPPDITHHS